jgi:hypothetical protein
VTRAECEGRTVLAQWLYLIVIVQKLDEGGKGGRGVAVNAGWDGICSQCLAPVVEGEAMDVRL